MYYTMSADDVGDYITPAVSKKCESRTDVDDVRQIRLSADKLKSGFRNLTKSILGQIVSDDFGLMPWRGCMAAAGRPNEIVTDAHSSVSDIPARYTADVLSVQ